MTRFFDLRVSAVGGGLANTVSLFQGTSIRDYAGLDRAQLLSDIRGRHVLIGAHGFNVNRADGIAHLSNWEGLLQLMPPSVFIGLLWPGDSVWMHGLDYPGEPGIANEAGDRLAEFVDSTLSDAASISFASHSLGARVVLRTVSKMTRLVRRVILMAGAIDNNCLSTEFKALASRTKIEVVSVLASKEDRVLSMLFPLGNFLGGILAEGHPWWHAALGHGGPSNPKPSNFRPPYQIADNWEFGHGSYLQIDSPPVPAIPLPAEVLPKGSPKPLNGPPGWQESFSAAFCSTRFQ